MTTTRRKIYSAYGIDGRKLEIVEGRYGRYATIFSYMTWKKRRLDKATFRLSVSLFDICNYFGFNSYFLYMKKTSPFIVNDVRFFVYYISGFDVYVVFYDKENKYNVHDKRRYNIINIEFDNFDSDTIGELAAKYVDKDYSPSKLNHYIAAELAYLHFFSK